MKINKLDTKDLDKYEELAIKYGTIFDTINWLKIYDNNVSIHGIYDKGNNLIGGFHLYEKKRLGLAICCDAPFAPSSGPFLKLESQNPVAIMKKWKNVLASMAEYIEDMRYHVVSISLDKNVLDVQPFIWKKNKVVPRYTYILDLHKSLEVLRRNMSSERRKNINKGIRDGLRAKRISEYDIVKSLIFKTFLRQDKKINECYINKILFEFADKENSFAFVTFKKINPIAAIFCIHDNNTAYYLLGGYDDEDKHHGAGALAMWEAIKYSKKLGLMYFDFEGSDVPQIERYFRGFGGLLIPYYRVNKAKLFLEILLKFFKRELF